MRVELPAGQWAEMRGIDELKARDKIAMERVITWAQSQEDDAGPSEIPLHGGLAEEMQMVLLCNIITEWSYGPVPVTRDQLLDLPVAVYNALSDAVQDHMKVVMARPNRGTPSA